MTSFVIYISDITYTNKWHNTNKMIIIMFLCYKLWLLFHLELLWVTTLCKWLRKHFITPIWISFNDRSTLPYLFLRIRFFSYLSLRRECVVWWAIIDSPECPRQTKTSILNICYHFNSCFVKIKADCSWSHSSYEMSFSMKYLYERNIRDNAL